MWGRIRHKVSRSRDSVPATTYDEQQDSIDDEVTSSDFSRLSLSNSSDFGYNSYPSSNADQTQAVADEVTSSSSMVHGLSNHSFDSLKNQQQFNGNHLLNNHVSSDISMLNRFQTASSGQEKTTSSCVAFPQNGNGKTVKYADFEKYSHRENCNGYATDESRKVGSDSRQVLEELSKNPVTESCQRVSSSPPKLMRREKVRTGEVSELRKSRLSSHLKNYGESASSFPKPLELPPHQKLANYRLTPDDMQADEAVFEAQISGTAAGKKPNVMLSSRSASDGRMSTEPSTAESTDSGIQPSLCSGNEDRGLNSSGAEDDPQDDPCSEHFISQNSDYMLLEDAKAMMAHSLPAGGSCTDYVDHFVVERLQNTHGNTTADISSNHVQQVPMDYVPYCESVTVLRRISHDSVDEKKVRPPTSGSKADYVPVDSSFTVLYNGQSVKQNGTSAFVTRGTGTDDHEHGRRAYLPTMNHRVSDYSSKSESTLNGSLTAAMEVSGTGNMPVGFDIDSDDDSYIPPLPTRNYRKTSEKYTEDVSLSSDTLSGHVSVESANEERTHMSWEEVMKEAHALGIPLAAPRSEISDWKSSVSVASSDMSDSIDNLAPYSRFDRMSSSEHGAIASSCAPEEKDISNTSQTNSPSKISGLAKCASPFKEKFRLHNLFSKKKNKKTDAVDGEVKDSSRIVQRHSSAAAEIQRRNLPPLPPKRSQATGSSMSRSSLDPIPPSTEFSRQHGHAHRTLSTLTLPARDSTSGLMTGSVWAGSSASVGCQSEMSESGISSRSVSGIESHRDLLTQGNFVHFLHALHC